MADRKISFDAPKYDADAETLTQAISVASGGAVELYLNAERVIAHSVVVSLVTSGVESMPSEWAYCTTAQFSFEPQTRTRMYAIEAIIPGRNFSDYADVQYIGYEGISYREAREIAWESRNGQVRVTWRAWRYS